MWIADLCGSWWYCGIPSGTRWQLSGVLPFAMVMRIPWDPVSPFDWSSCFNQMLVPDFSWFQKIQYDTYRCFRTSQHSLHLALSLIWCTNNTRFQSIVLKRAQPAQATQIKMKSEPSFTQWVRTTLACEDIHPISNLKLDLFWFDLI